MYSQRNEESFIEKFFEGKKNGRFLDIGAYDGKTFSNTHRLYELGWTGVCVEPSEKPYLKLRELYRDDKRMNLINAVVSNKSEIINFYDSNGDALSTTHIPHKQKWEMNANVIFEMMRTTSIPVDELITEVFDFVNIDTEGTSYQILTYFPNDYLKQVKMICIEFDSLRNEIMSKLIPLGFNLFHQTAENLLLTRA